MDVINLSNRAPHKRGPDVRPGSGSAGSSPAAGTAKRPGHIATAVAAVIAVGLLAGCGTAAPSVGPGTKATPSKATLTVNFIDRAQGVSKHWTLRCDPVSGNTPDGTALCRMLRGDKNPFGRPLHVMCPMIIISGRQIIISGTWFGQKVHRVFIDGGCDLPIFNQLSKTIY